MRTNQLQIYRLQWKDDKFRVKKLSIWIIWHCKLKFESLFFSSFATSFTFHIVFFLRVFLLFYSSQILSFQSSQCLMAVWHTFLIKRCWRGQFVLVCKDLTELGLKQTSCRGFKQTQGGYNQCTSWLPFKPLQQLF